MTTQISAETLSTVTYHQIPVITTDLLAKLYGTDTDNIKKNYSRNQDRFVAGKHYFKLECIELKEFKDKVTSSHLVASRAKHLILWTERGAARHAKMLETDQAWDVFEKLEDCYFNQREKPKPAKKADLVNLPGEEYRYRARVIIYDNLFGGIVEFFGKANSIRTVVYGISTDLGFEPTSFIEVPMRKDKLKRIR